MDGIVFSLRGRTGRRRRMRTEKNSNAPESVHTCTDEKQESVHTVTVSHRICHNPRTGANRH